LLNAEELLLAPGRVFPRDKAQPCGQIAGFLELVPIADGRKKGCGAQCSGPGDRHEPSGNIFSICNCSDLRRHVVDALLETVQVGKQIREQFSHRRREVV
jgi:hypothetical protein